MGVLVRSIDSVFATEYNLPSRKNCALTSAKIFERFKIEFASKNVDKTTKYSSKLNKPNNDSIARSRSPIVR